MWLTHTHTHTHKDSCHHWVQRVTLLSVQTERSLCLQLKPAKCQERLTETSKHNLELPLGKTRTGGGLTVQTGIESSSPNESSASWCASCNRTQTQRRHTLTHTWCTGVIRLSAPAGWNMFTWTTVWTEDTPTSLQRLTVHASYTAQVSWCCYKCLETERKNILLLVEISRNQWNRKHNSSSKSYIRYKQNTNLYASYEAAAKKQVST